MPTLHWWTGASSISPYVITIAWGITSDIIIHPLPTSFSYIVLRLLTFPLLLLSSLQNTKNITFTIVTFYYRYHHYHITLLLNTLLQILSYLGVDELTTQLLVLKNILWLPLCQINKFGLNTLPSKAIAIPTLVGYQDYFLAPLPGSIALFFESLGIYICLSLLRNWEIQKNLSLNYEGR